MDELWVKQMEREVADLDRDACVKALESVGIACYDHEDTATLRDAVLANIQDGTLDPDDVF
jgi:hypothetical protein